MPNEAQRLEIILEALITSQDPYFEAYVSTFLQDLCEKKLLTIPIYLSVWPPIDSIKYALCT